MSQLDLTKNNANVSRRHLMDQERSFSRWYSLVGIRGFSVVKLLVEMMERYLVCSNSPQDMTPTWSICKQALMV